MQSGLVPTLVNALTTHAALAQDATNATITHAALSHLQRCRSEFDSLALLAQAGRLPEAVETCEGLDALLDEAPIPLNQADVVGDMKVGIHAARYIGWTKKSTAKIACGEKPDAGTVKRRLYAMHHHFFFRNYGSALHPKYV